jgi:hypothetical protein
MVKLPFAMLLWLEQLWDQPASAYRCNGESVFKCTLRAGFADSKEKNVIAQNKVVAATYMH